MQLFSGNKGFRDEPLIRICDSSQIVCVATQTLLAVNEMPDKAFILRRNQLIHVFSYILQFYRKIAVKLNFTDILLQKMKCLTGHFIFGKQRLWVTTSKDNKICNFVLVKGKPLKPYILKSNNTHEK